MKLTKLSLAGIIMTLSIPAFAQYSTVNPAIPVNSVLGKNQSQIEDYIYKNKPKFKTSSMLGFDDIRLKFQKANNFSNVSVSYLTTSGIKTICNVNVVIHDDGRIFSMSPDYIKPKFNLTENDVSQLNMLKLQSLLYGCGLDTQANPIGDSTQDKEFTKINEFYKNGQIFKKDVVIDGKKVEAVYPSLYLLYRNNYSDLLAMTQTIKSSDNKDLKKLFGLYQTQNKLLASYYREKTGIPQWESFNSFDLALKENLFNNLQGVSDKELENKIKSISHEAVMGTYLLGQREQTESIMDIGTIKETALIYTLQMLDKDYDARTNETVFNVHQTPNNNMAMKISKDTISYIKNTNPLISGYNPKLSKTSSQNLKAISNFINNYIETHQLNKIAEIEYENMKTLYPDSQIDIGLSDINTLGFFASPEQRTRVYKNIFNEHQKYLN